MHMQVLKTFKSPEESQIKITMSLTSNLLNWLSYMQLLYDGIMEEEGEVLSVVGESAN